MEDWNVQTGDSLIHVQTYPAEYASSESGMSESDADTNYVDSDEENESNAQQLIENIQYMDEQMVNACDIRE